MKDLLDQSACENLEKLCVKYSGRLPRYTSYPTAVEFESCSDPAPIENVLKSAGKRHERLSLYVHLPYCPSLCYFCACNKIISQDESKRRDYLQILEDECRLIHEKSQGGITFGQIHLGGGSPSYLSVEEFQILDDIFTKQFNIDPDCVKSIEVDPRSFTREKAEKLVELGYRRFSLGVQDFDPKVQEIINRIQPYDLTKQTINYFRDLGMKAINLDLIYGLPGQELATFADTVEKVCTLRPERVALYGYAHVKWKVKVQNVFHKHGVPEAEVRLKLFTHAVAALQEAGYEYIGFDHFALPEDELSIARHNGTLQRNFMGYTTVEGNGVLGVGVSSISDIGGVLYQNHTALEKYQSAVDNAELPIGKILERSEDDLIRAFIIERLMCDCKLSAEDVALAFPENAEALRIFQEGLEKLQVYEEDGFVSVCTNNVEITTLGRFFLRHIAAEFDAYLEKHSSKSESTFSQAV